MPEIWNQNEMKFTLVSGREVQLSALRLRMTYEGILEGTPGPRMNQRVLDQLDPPEHWRSTAVCIDTPKDLSGSLPHWVCFGEFVSWKGIHTPGTYSQLNYIWFIDSPDGKSLRELVATALDALDWEEFAEELDEGMF
jgi:hypothetical protein